MCSTYCWRQKKAGDYFGSEGGSIINLSSVVSTLASPNSAAYTGTKGAVDSITKALANELGLRKIGLNGKFPSTTS